jgi:hypothetical protein
MILLKLNAILFSKITSLLSLQPKLFKCIIYHIRQQNEKEKNWWVAIKTRAKTLSKFQLTEESDNLVPTVPDFFQEDSPCCQFIVDIEDDIPQMLNNENIIETLSTAEVEFILQQRANEIPEIETSNSKYDTDYQRELFDNLPAEDNECESQTKLDSK